MRASSSRVFPTATLTSLLLVFSGCHGGGTATDGGTKLDAGRPGEPQGQTLRITVQQYHTDEDALLSFGTPINALWVGVQDGDGGWAYVPGDDAGTYTATILDAQGNYRAAVVCPPGQGGNTATATFEATLGELPVIPVTCFTAGSTDWHHVSLTAHNFGAGDGGLLALGPVTHSLDEDADNSSSGTTLPSGTYDLLAVDAEGSTTLGAYVQRGVSVQDDVDLDVDLSHQVTLTGFQVTVSGGLSENASLDVHSSLYTEHLGEIVLSSRMNTTTSTQLELPEAARVSTDSYAVWARISQAGSVTQHTHRTALPTDLTLTPPTPLSSVSVGFSGDSSFHALTFSWAGGPTDAYLSAGCDTSSHIEEPLQGSTIVVSPKRAGDAHTFTQASLANAPGYLTSYDITAADASACTLRLFKLSQPDLLFAGYQGSDLDTWSASFFTLPN